MPSASVLPSSRASSAPSSALRARISSDALRSTAWRSSGPERDHAGKAALAAAMAAWVSATVARAYSPTTSLVSEGLMLGMARPEIHSPATRFWWRVMPWSLMRSMMRTLSPPAGVGRARESGKKTYPALFLLYTSKNTAASSTRPLMTCCQSMPMPMIDMPLFITPMMKAPTTAPMILPTPP